MSRSRCLAFALALFAVLPATAAAQTTASDLYPSAAMEDATIAQLNLRRTQIGMPPLAVSAALSTAARGHAAYLARNDEADHTQFANRPGFTGVDPAARIAAAGYPLTLYGEVLSFRSLGKYAVEGLLAAIYHRFTMFIPDLSEVGSGAVTNHPSFLGVTAIDLGRRTPNAAPTLDLALYPTNGQEGVPVLFSSDEEAPDPVPNVDVVGYPISIHASVYRRLVVSSFSLSGNGSTVPARLLTSETDIHTPTYGAAIIPLGRLAFGTTYTARAQGTIDGLPFDRSWQFTTMPLNALTAYPSRLCLVNGRVASLQLGGGAGRLGNILFSDTSVVDVDIVSGEALMVRGRALGSASITVEDLDRRRTVVPVTVATSCAEDKRDADRVFDWAEQVLPGIFAPARQPSQRGAGYYFRYYPATGVYMGERDGKIYLLVEADGRLINPGDLIDFLPAAATAGF